MCTSGIPDDLEVTDTLAADVLKGQMETAPTSIQPQLRANLGNYLGVVSTSNQFNDCFIYFNADWILAAQANALVVGSQARILYSDLEGRIECAGRVHWLNCYSFISTLTTFLINVVRMNTAVREGRIKAPVVIGRDHHDVC